MKGHAIRSFCARALGFTTAPDAFRLERASLNEEREALEAEARDLHESQKEARRTFEDAARNLNSVVDRRRKVGKLMAQNAAKFALLKKLSSSGGNRKWLL